MRDFYYHNNRTILSWIKSFFIMKPNKKHATYMYITMFCIWIRKMSATCETVTNTFEDAQKLKSKTYIRWNWCIKLLKHIYVDQVHVIEFCFSQKYFSFDAYSGKNQINVFKSAELYIRHLSCDFHIFIPWNTHPIVICEP